MIAVGQNVIIKPIKSDNVSEGSIIMVESSLC